MLLQAVRTLGKIAEENLYLAPSENAGESSLFSDLLQTPKPRSNEALTKRKDFHLKPYQVLKCILENANHSYLPFVHRLK